MLVSKQAVMSTLFFDIESVARAETLEGLDEVMQGEWKHKCETRYRKLMDEGMSYDDILFEKGALELDFAQIVCVSLGIYKDGTQNKLMSVWGTDEKDILIRLANGLEKTNKDKLGGANIKNYDIPLLIRAYIRHGLKVPKILLRIVNAKPWEQDSYCLDITDFWSFGNYNLRFNRFNTVCHELGVASPKSDIEGKDVTKVFYNEGEVGLERIVKYCERDTNAVIECYERLLEIYAD